jgi:hypothetical protein
MKTGWSRESIRALPPGEFKAHIDALTRTSDE